MVSLASVVLIALTSGVAFAVGVRWLKLPAALLRQAAPRTLEAVGFTAVFFAVNTAGWVIAVLGVRAVLGWFVSIYLFSGVTVGVLSAVQGVMFQRWWESSRYALRKQLRVNLD